MSGSPKKSEKQQKHQDLINSLVEKKRVCIENLQFEQARELEKEIQSHNVINYDETVKERGEALQKEIEGFYNKSKTLKEEASNATEEAELEVREHYDLAFQDVQTRHLQELMEVEKEYALEVIKARKRPVPMQIEYQRQARQLAKDNDFDTALRLRTKAEEAFEIEMHTRRVAINSKFNQIRKLAYTKMRNELLILNNKLIEAINANQKELEDKNASIERTFKVNYLSAQQKALLDLTKVFKSRESKLMISEKLNNYVREIVSELTGEAPENVSATATPRKSASRKSSTPSTPNNESQQLQETPKKDDAAYEEEQYNNEEEDLNRILNEEEELAQANNEEEQAAQDDDDVLGDLLEEEDQFDATKITNDENDDLADLNDEV